MNPAPGAVRLVGLPVDMFDAAVEQWEGMLREYTLRGMGGEQQPYSATEITRAGAALGIVAEAVLTADPSDRDITIRLGDHTAGDLSLLQGILDDARHLALTGELLVLPSLPEIVALRDWICGETTEQVAGADPTPWWLEIADDPADTAAPEWDDSLVPPADTAWLVGDDRNRIVAASPAALALLGWTDEDLVGQRLLVVIPPSLREAHIAGFTRSVVSGGGELLGRPIALPALGRDGKEVPVQLTLTRHAARAGRDVYLAQLNPAL